MSDLKAALEASLARMGGSRPDLYDQPGKVIQVGFLPWPDVASMRHVSTKAGRCYESLTGAFPTPLPGVTTFLKVLGLGTEGLIKWSATEERKAALEAAGKVYGDWLQHGIRGEAATFVATVDAEIGPARQHQKQLTKAGDIGTAAHLAIHDWLCGKPIPKDLPDASLWAVMSFQDWFSESKFKFIRGEQPVYDLEWGFAGTIDFLFQAPDGVLEVWDLKTSANIYDDFHLQLAAYAKAARNFADVRAGGIVRVPKTADDVRMEVKRIGECYNRNLTIDQLLVAVKAALDCWKILKS